MKAAIDIGSNSIRLARSDGLALSRITKLADGLEKSGKLSPTGVADTIKALLEFRELTAGCERVTAFATEAVRKASDGGEFVALAEKQCGLKIRVLSGDEEARLALMGAIKPEGAVTVCDLGGGSMELISSKDGVTPEYAESLPLGVVVLKNRYRGDYRALINDAPALVSKYKQKPTYPLVAIGGSACTIASAILNLNVYDKTKINGMHISAKDLDGVLPLLMSKHLKTLRPLCAKRADTVAYGAIILGALINVLGLDGFTVSDSGNLDAILNQA